MTPISVALNTLVLSPVNVRKVETNVDDLASNIFSNGLLQNLTAVEINGKYEVVAGGRRLQAMQQLLSEGRITQDYLVEIKLCSQDEAINFSLSENSARENMSPIDEYQAFSALIKQGKTAEDIAVIYNITPDTVSRRMKLAHVAPSLLALFYEDEIEIAQLMALATTDNHALQESIWENASSWKKSPDHLRRAIIDQLQQVSSTDAIARFITIPAYREAGGTIEIDLFNDEEDGAFLLSNAPLVNELAIAKIEDYIDQQVSQGTYAWVDYDLTRNSYEYGAYSKVWGKVGEMGESDAKLYKTNNTKIDALETKNHQIDWEADDAQEQEDRIESLLEPLEAIKNDLEGKYTQYSPEQKPFVGGYITIEENGTLKLEGGLIRAGDLKKAIKGSSNLTEDGQAENKTPDHPASLVLALTAHRSLALQAEIASDPLKALIILTARILSSANHTYHDGFHSVKIGAHNAESTLTRNDASIVDGKAYSLLNEKKLRWNSLIQSKDLLRDLSKLSTDEILEVLAYATALTVDCTTANDQVDKKSSFSVLGKFVGLNTANWFTPTASNYFGKLGKAFLIKMIGKLDSKKAVGADKLKRAQLAEIAEQLHQDSQFLPEIMKP